MTKHVNLVMSLVRSVQIILIIAWNALSSIILIISYVYANGIQTNLMIQKYANLLQRYNQNIVLKEITQLITPYVICAVNPAILVSALDLLTVPAVKMIQYQKNYTKQRILVQEDVHVQRDTTNYMESVMNVTILAKHVMEDPMLIV